jgi:Ca2+-binding EF-hand superfamily protein
MDADERLSKYEDLPEWFGDLDANRDGQVMMDEYYASWSEKKATDFRQFDLNDDGIVTPKEAIAAGQDGAVRGAGGSSRSRSRERGSSRTSSSSRSSRSRSSGGRAEQYRKHAANWLQKFDSDKDGVLAKEEWSKEGFTYTTADTDGDGKVTVNELAEAMAKK